MMTCCSLPVHSELETHVHYDGPAVKNGIVLASLSQAPESDFNFLPLAEHPCTITAVSRTRLCSEPQSPCLIILSPDEAPGGLSCCVLHSQQSNSPWSSPWGAKLTMSKIIYILYLSGLILYFVWCYCYLYLRNLFQYNLGQKMGVSGGFPIT